MADNQYLAAVDKVFTRGTRKENRTGIDTISTFNINYEIDLREGFPLLTTKYINWKNIVVEMLWFLSGQTNINILKRHNCKFWDEWADPKTGEVPSAYGNFWRHYPIHVPSTKDYLPAPTIGYMDQIAKTVEKLKKDPLSRRLVTLAWAPGNAWTSTLPPCHAVFICNVQNLRIPIDLTDDVNTLREKGRLPPDRFKADEPPTAQHLCLHLTQRSCDMALGVPYNIASYALLMHLLGRFSGLPVGIFAHTLVDAHIYTSKPDGSIPHPLQDHAPGLREQLKREPRPLPRLTIDSSIKSLEDMDRLLDLPTSDLMDLFKLEGYDPHPEIKFKVAV